MRTTKKFATILIFASIFAATPVLAASDTMTKPYGMSEHDWNDFLKQYSDSSNDTDATKPFDMSECDWHEFLAQLEDHSSEDADTTKQFDLSKLYDFFEKHKTDMQDDVLTNAKGLYVSCFDDMAQEWPTESAKEIHYPRKNSREDIDAITNASDMHECESNCCCCKSHHKHQGRPEHRRHQKDSLKTKTSDKNENRKSDRHIYHRWN